MNRALGDQSEEPLDSDRAWNVIRSTRWMQVSIVLFTVFGSVAVYLLLRG